MQREEGQMILFSTEAGWFFAFGIRLETFNDKRGEGPRLWCNKEVYATVLIGFRGLEQ